MRLFENWLLATDLDGTLYEKEGVIPQENLDAIAYFIDNGGRFTVATGRPIESTRVLMKQVPLSCPAITCNGHALYDFAGDNMILCHNYPDSAVEVVAALTQAFPSLGAECYSGRETYIVRSNAHIADHNKFEPLRHTVSSAEELRGIPFCKIIFADEADVIRRVWQFASDIRAEGVTFIDTHPNYIELQIAGKSKGTALEELGAVCGIPNSQLCAIGNYYNDTELIRAAGIGALVCGSPERMLPLADYVTRRRCGEGALADFIGYIETLAKSTAARR